ncbi:MAG: hypothetical protein EXS51_00250 [Candidatus Taylorbacteria bacterium]|nr:hypothetical protein [Candidatus Taylorbacteria bacterium]
MQIQTGKRKSTKERKARIATVQKAVLFSLAAAGGLTLALLAPNALQVLEQFGWVKTKRNFRQTINISVERLSRAGLIIKDNDGHINLTKRGEQRLSELERMHYRIDQPKRWDNKWRLVSFDIKETRKEVRELLRSTLQSVGFVRLHRSVWVYPHDCEDFLSLLKVDYHIGVEVLYIIADYIENDGWLRKHFDLS